MDENDTGSRWLTAHEAADIVGVNYRTIHAWVRSGALTGVILARKHGYRINERDLHRFLRSQAAVTRAREALHNQGKPKAGKQAFAA